VVPSWDLKTLWVANNAEGRTDGSLTPIDPKTGKPGPVVAVDDPYNMYFTPDGKDAIVVAEARARLDFRDAHTMALKFSVPTPGCKGINHADFSIDGKYAIFTCEFEGRLAKIDMVHHKVMGYLTLDKGGMPQDIRISPDGKVFYVADMMAVYLESRLEPHPWPAPRQGQCLGARLCHAQGDCDLADPGWWQPRHGQRQCGRQDAVAVGPV
jgi:DNA-binding beta-propeller fold protein YncE